MNIELKNKTLNDEYTKYVYETYDIQNQNESIENISFNLGEAKNLDWNIGVIYGSSGSGKTTILKRIGELSKCIFDYDKALVSNFDWLTPEEATSLLSSIGLSSVPTWLRPFRLLSNGEQYRAELAYKVSKAKDNDIILIDEFTSVVDRDVAKAMSYALQKYIRKHNKKIILASCHFDIFEWLMPDWTCSPQKGGTLERGDYLRQGRQKIELQVSRVEYETWNLFKKHHYLTEDVNKSCKFLLFELNFKPIGIIALINQPNKNGKASAMGISRIVIMPDYQGMGLGVKICEFSSAILRNNGACNVYIKTVNPGLGEYFFKSEKWKPTSMNGKKGNTDAKAVNRKSRPSYCYEYVGEKMPGYKELLLPIGEMRDKKQLKLF